MPALLQQLSGLGGCTHPVRLDGHRTEHELNLETGEIGRTLHHLDSTTLPAGHLLVRCNNRRILQGALFTSDATVQIYAKTGPDSYDAVGGPLIGGSAVQYAVENYMAPHPELGSSHHVTADHLIEVDGDRAHMNAQFIVFKIQGAARPATGWPAGTFGAQGTVTPIESGYYDTDLYKIDGEWKITRHHVLMDVNIALPGA